MCSAVLDLSVFGGNIQVKTSQQEVFTGFARVLLKIFWLILIELFDKKWGKSQHSSSTAVDPKVSLLRWSSAAALQSGPTRFYFQMFTIFSISSSGPRWNPPTHLLFPTPLNAKLCPVNKPACLDTFCTLRSNFNGSTEGRGWRGDKNLASCLWSAVRSINWHWSDRNASLMPLWVQCDSECSASFLWFI